MKKLKSIIIKNIEIVLNLYESEMNQLSEVEKTDIEHLKICAKILRDENKPSDPNDLIYIIRNVS